MFVIYPSPIISSLTLLGTSRSLQVFWFSLNHFRGPVGGEENFLHHCEAWGAWRGCVRPLWPTYHASSPPVASSLCGPVGSSSWLDFTSLGKQALRSPIYWVSSHHYTLSLLPFQLALCDELDCFLLTLCLPPACRNSSKSSREPPITPGIPPNL